MGNEESSANPLPFVSSLTDDQIIFIDPRDVSREWKHSAHPFFFFVDATIVKRRDVLTKVILEACKRFCHHDEEAEKKVTFLLDLQTKKSLLSDFIAFRVRYGNRCLIGFVETVSIRSKNASIPYKEEKASTNPEETKLQLQQMIENPDTTNEEVNIESIMKYINNDKGKEEKKSTQRVLQPSSQETGKTYSRVTINLDASKTIQLACPILFSTSDSNHMPKSFSEAEKIEKFCGVSAVAVAKVFGFLEAPKGSIYVNEPFVHSDDISVFVNQWRRYNEDFQIKLRWMYLVKEPSFQKLTPEMIQQDNINILENDLDYLLPYVVEYWNKSHLRYHFTLLNSHSFAPVWKTRIYLYREKEEGTVKIFRHIFTPIWSVVDEEAVNKISQSQPISLKQRAFSFMVAAYPTSTIYESRRVRFSMDRIATSPITPKITSLADFEAQLQKPSAIQSDSEEECSEGEYSEEEDVDTEWKLQHSLIDLASLPNELLTDLFHAILRKHGVNQDLERIFGEKHVKVSGLTIPNRFQRKSTRADSKAESLIVILGEIASTFNYLNLSECTLSSQSLEILAPKLNNVVDLNLSRCSGIMEWGFLLYLKKNLLYLNISCLEQCGNSQQLCAMLAGLEKLQFLDISDSQVNISDLLFHLPQLPSLTSLHVQDTGSALEGGWLITDEELTFLVKSKAIRSLGLSGQQITSYGMYELLELPDLFELKVTTLLGFEKHKPLASLINLRSLSLTHSEVDDISIECVLENLTSLTALDLSHNVITGFGLHSFAGMMDLQTLNVSYNDIGLDRNMDHKCFGAVQNLTYLDISANPIVAMRPWMQKKKILSHFSFLLDVPKLTTLVMNYTEVENGMENGGMYYLRHLSCLTSLSLRNHRITDGCVNKLKYFKELQHVDLSENLITNETIKDLQYLPSLTSISAENTVLTDSALLHFTRFPRLKLVNLAETRVSQRAISLIELKCPHIVMNTTRKTTNKL